MHSKNIKKIVKILFPLFFFLFLSIILFRPYFFERKVPFAANLLVAFYEPWKSYPFPNYPEGPANKPIGFDTLKIFYPLRRLTIDSLKHFQLPLWNPYDFSGNTQLATYQSAVFFPLTPLFFIFPFIDAWSLVVILGPFLAGIFTYYFLRSLSISGKGSLLGALAFGFSGTILVLAEESFMSMYSILFLPLIMLGIKQMFDQKRFRWFSLIVVSTAFSILSGWFQSSLYAIGLSIVWLLFLTKQTKQYKTFFSVFFAIILAFLLSSPHLIPNIESFIYSARGTTDAKFLFNWYLVSPWHVITFLAPDFFGSPGTYNYFGKGFYYEKILYIGVVGFILGLIAFFSRKKNPENWFFSISWIITLSLGFSLPTSWFFLYDLHLPFISTILPSRIFLLSAFCLSVLAGYGWDLLQNSKVKISIFFTILFTTVMLAIAWVFVWHQKQINPLGGYATVSLRNLILPTFFSVVTIFTVLVAKLIKIKQMKLISFCLLLFISLFSIIYFGSKYFYFSERKFIFPANPVFTQLSDRLGINRFWSYGPGYINRNFGTYYNLQTPEGYDSLYIRQYGEFIQATKNKGEYTPDVIRADAQLVSDQRLSEIGENPYLLKALDLLGVTAIAAKENPADDLYAANDITHRFTPIWKDNVYTIFQNNYAYPRAFLIDSFTVITDPQKVFAYLFADTTNLRTHVVLNAYPKIHLSGKSINGKVTVISYAPEKVAVSVTTNHNALLFLSDNNYPGWTAYMDGKKTDVLTADYTFRAVVVPKGKHTVIFMYQPLSVAIGFIVFGIGALLFIIVGFMMKKRIL